MEHAVVDSPGSWLILMLGNRPLLIIGTLLIIVGIQFILFGLLAEMIAFSAHREADYAIVEKSDDVQPDLLETKKTPEAIARGMSDR